MKKAFIVIIILLILGVGGYFGYKHYFAKPSEVKKVKKIYTDKIKGYGYRLEKRDTKLFKEKFQELKKVLEKDNVDLEKYAELLAQLYIIDLYTISNKDSTYDVGSTEFIYPDALENYELKVKDTLYRYVEDNTDKKRKQQLPEVSSITVKDIEKGTFKLKSKESSSESEIELESYTVTLSWNYKTDLSYDKKAKITMVKGENDKKLYVVEQTNNNKNDSDENDE